MGYGKGPVIYGLDSCHRYRRKVPANRRTIAIAGMPNTGTNAMYKMLKNCNVSYRWQVPWKKHLPYHSSAEYDAKDLLPVVLIKDPLEWLASTCRKQYFKVRTGKSCPSPIINMSGTYFETATPETHKPFNNIVELWSNWHLEYLAAEVPLLMIRTEDLLFNPLEVRWRPLTRLLCSSLLRSGEKDTALRATVLKFWIATPRRGLRWSSVSPNKTERPSTSSQMLSSWISSAIVCRA